ncbi:MAG TPA: holo-ACP synthase [Bacteroidales bacterium]|jgi:holo-[acyl-carrier protein] synthase|nr:holo-ACP synthase [Bacteroidales bacterium]MDD4086679.1 holo-ACP synthase [Bacteroidales bacterium]MDY0086354.1 holo-ACP synthase [Bacteroidales bacterium]HPE44161.1 holo-ACP synthase [Bacteroidales bacterium]
MIFGIGNDIIEVSRMERQLTNSTSLKEKLFTLREQAYADDKVSKYQHYAARFAAKEAFFKALGTGYRYGMAFHEIEVINDELGKPVIHLHGKVKDFIEKQQVKHIHLSISHVKEMASAFVVLEK